MPREEPACRPALIPANRKLPMKTLTTFAVLLALGATAQAKLTPNDKVPSASRPVEDAVMYGGPIGAMLETNYFRDARSAFGGVSSCRLRQYFTEPRFARPCE